MKNPSRCRSSLVLALFLLLTVLSPAGAQTADRFLVIPFENIAKDVRGYWLGEAAAVLLSDELNALGRRAYTREERLEAFDQLQLPAIATLTHATVIRLGHLLGATHVVTGSFRLSGNQLSLRARTIRLESGRMEQEVGESGALDEFFAIFERMGRRLSGTSGAFPSVAKPALPVFENYVKGLIATGRATKINYLQTTTKLDPGFDRARLALWAVQHEDENYQAALVAATAVRENSPLYPRARFCAALSLIQLNRLDDALATLRALADRTPAATVLNNIGIIQLRRNAPDDGGRASSFFSQAVKLDRDDPDYYFNLGYAYWAEKDPKSAIVWLREAVRRDPADGEAHAVLSAALQSTGASAEAARERELATQLSSTYAEWAKKAGGPGIPQGLERIKPSLELSALRRVDSAIATAGQREQKELTAFHLDRGRRFFEQGNSAEAITELRRAIYLSPYEADAHLLLGRIYLGSGQTPAAVDAFKIAIWSHETAEAQAALARAYLQLQDRAAARRAAERALVLDPSSAEASELLAKLK